MVRDSSTASENKINVKTSARLASRVAAEAPSAKDSLHRQIQDRLLKEPVLYLHEWRLSNRLSIYIYTWNKTVVGPALQALVCPRNGNRRSGRCFTIGRVLNMPLLKKTLGSLRKWLGFSGRIGRLDYWCCYIFPARCFLAVQAITNPHSSGCWRR